VCHAPNQLGWLQGRLNRLQAAAAPLLACRAPPAAPGAQTCWCLPCCVPAGWFSWLPLAVARSAGCSGQSAWLKARQAASPATAVLVLLLPCCASARPPSGAAVPSLLSDWPSWPAGRLSRLPACATSQPAWLRLADLLSAGAREPTRLV
jgi:hypothetical protein